VIAGKGLAWAEVGGIEERVCPEIWCLQIKQRTVTTSPGQKGGFKHTRSQSSRHRKHHGKKVKASGARLLNLEIFLTALGIASQGTKVECHNQWGGGLGGGIVLKKGGETNEACTRYLKRGLARKSQDQAKETSEKH